MSFRGLLLCLLLSSPALAQSISFGTHWQRDGLVTERFQIHGTGSRNNPLRRSLQQPFDGDELFVRFNLRYDADSIDTPTDGDGEFVVLWLDETEGGASSTHSPNVPNIGIHVSGEHNRFMVRYSPNAQRFGPLLEGDREYVVVARLWKSSPGAGESFDQLNLWVDPDSEDELKPLASAQSGRSITHVSWIGFSTGAKTEYEDVIEVGDITLAPSWEQILGLPPKQATESISLPAPPPPPTIDFATQVFPILKSRCFDCHAGEDVEGELHLDRWDEVLNQTTPRSAERSRLYELVASGEMPPENERLDEEELRILKTWIDEGVHWDEQLLPTPKPVSDHWAFQPIQRPKIPPVQHAEWVRTPVDAFIARAHEENGLSPAPEASTQTLQRRYSLTLRGLPPDVGEPSHSDESIDRMLSDPAYGERWGRHWLDIARWAESNGHQHNRLRPHAWRYRDWVVEAFRSDMPVDQFIRDQVAGDEVEPPQDDRRIATGFLAAARYSGNELDKQIQRNEILVDITNTTAQAFLGLTMQCAQCHTHRFDPISIRDYYRFQAFFAQGQPGNIVFAQSDPNAQNWIQQRWELFDSVHHRLVAVKRKQGHPEPIYVIPKSVVAGMKPPEKARFKSLEAKIASLNQSWSFYSPVSSAESTLVAPHEMRWPLPRDPGVLQANQTHVLVRGDVGVPGPAVEPGWPAVFGPAEVDPSKPRTSLANWLTDRNNPLTARVWVNRIWQWHFGRGLVESSGDFGTQGTQPTHPELLDYLASELIDSGWSTHAIQRLITESATYRQSSQFSQSNANIDPDNRLHWRWTPRRLEAEAIRDCVLAVAGQLDTTVGGESVGADSNRRSLYLRQRRDNFPDQQQLFDGAGGVVSCTRRRVSTTALQPLWMMNSPLVQQASEGLAHRSGSVEAAFEIALGRSGSEAELEPLRQLAEQYGLQSACLAILNSSEFLYIP